MYEHAIAAPNHCDIKPLKLKILHEEGTLIIIEWRWLFLLCGGSCLFGRQSSTFISLACQTLYPTATLAGGGLVNCLQQSRSVPPEPRGESTKYV